MVDVQARYAAAPKERRCCDLHRMAERADSTPHRTGEIGTPTRCVFVCSVISAQPRQPSARPGRRVGATGHRRGRGFNGHVDSGSCFVTAAKAVWLSAESVTLIRGVEILGCTRLGGSSPVSGSIASHHRAANCRSRRRNRSVDRRAHRPRPYPPASRQYLHCVVSPRDRPNRLVQRLGTTHALGCKLFAVLMMHLWHCMAAKTRSVGLCGGASRYRLNKPNLALT